MTTNARLLHAGKPLTPREIEILQAAADGETTAAIARRLVLSPQTIRSHRKRILGKLAARNMPNAIAIALRRSLIT